MSIKNDFNSQSKVGNNEISVKELILKFRDAFQFFKKRWKTLIIISLFCGFLGVSYSLILKPKYKAVLTFAMEEDKGTSNNGGISSALGLANSFGIDIGGGNGGGAFSAVNLSELMKSRLIVEKALLNKLKLKNREITLVEYYIEKNNLRDKWRKNNNLKNLHFGPNLVRSKFSFLHDSIMYELHKILIDKENLSIIQKDKKVTIFSIIVNSKNENFSKFFCENIAKETSEFYIQTKSKKARSNVEILERQVDSLRFQLNNSINSVAKSVDDVYNLNPAYNIKGASSKRKQVDVQANSTILSNILVQLELAKITLRKETPLIQLIDSPILPLEKEELSKKYAFIFGFIVSLFIQIFGMFLFNIIKEVK